MAAGTRRKRQRTRARAHPQQERVAEIIGRASYATAATGLYRSRAGLTTVDDTRTDYSFYDLLRRGKQPGFRLGALFAKRIENIYASWVLGRGITVKLAEGGDDDNPNDARNQTDQALVDFLDAEHSQLMTVKEDALGLGDQFVFVNPDGSLSVPSPDTVEETRDPYDYRTVTQVTINTQLPAYHVADVYTAAERVITWTKGSEVVRRERYANLIGRLPYVRIANARSGNETYGHSIHEDLLKLYDQYDDVIHKQLDGVKLLGNPIPAFTGLEDLAAVIDANKPMVNSTYSDRDGIEVTRPELNIDKNSIMLIGKGGDFKFVSGPTGFTADTQQALKTLYMLMVERTGIPEPLWGNEMGSARASSETQMRQWAHTVEGMQRADELWLRELCEIWLAWRALTDPQTVADKLAVEWPPVLDENQELRLRMLEFAAAQNLLTDKTKLELTELPVENLDDEIEDAAGEAQARATEQMAQMKAQAALQPPQERMARNGNGVGEMNGYGETDAQAIVAGAIRQLAGGA